MRTVLGMALALSMWAATATKDSTHSPEWESMPKQAVTQEAVSAAAGPQEPKAPSAAETLVKAQVAAAPAEPDADLFPMPLRIAIALAVVAMIAYVAATRLS